MTQEYLKEGATERVLLCDEQFEECRQRARLHGFTIRRMPRNECGASAGEIDRVKTIVDELIVVLCKHPSSRYAINRFRITRKTSEIAEAKQ